MIGVAADSDLCYNSLSHSIGDAAMNVSLTPELEKRIAE